MSFEAFETSKDRGGIVQLYRFDYGQLSTERLGYTSHTKPITVDHAGAVGEVTYEPVPVARDQVVSTGTLDRQSIKIELDVSTEIAELFRVYPPSSVVSLVIYEGHVDDPDAEYVVIWAGRVVAANRQSSRLEISGEPIATQMRRSGLRRHYQYGCPLILYGKDLGIGTCEASKAAATVASTVSAIAGTVVTLAGGWEGSFAATKFIRGNLEWNPAGRSTQYRTIIRVSGNQLTLSGVPTDLEVGDAVDVVLGCNHRAFATDDGDCEALHDALPSFGGHPFIPTTNVIRKNPFY